MVMTTVCACMYDLVTDRMGRTSLIAPDGSLQNLPVF